MASQNMEVDASWIISNLEGELPPYRGVLLDRVWILTSLS